MNINKICTYLEDNHGFTGDLMDASDAAKDYAVKHYLLGMDNSELYEYFPAEINFPRHMIEHLYAYPTRFGQLWLDQWKLINAVQKPQSLSERTQVEDQMFSSEALFNSPNIKKNLIVADFILFAEEVANAFYQYAESSLRDKLEDAYNENRYFEKQDQAATEADLINDQLRLARA